MDSLLSQVEKLSKNEKLNLINTLKKQIYDKCDGCVKNKASVTFCTSCKKNKCSNCSSYWTGDNKGRHCSSCKYDRDMEEDGPGRHY